MQTNIKVLDLIQSKLKRGDIQKIAEVTGYTRQFVGMVLSLNTDTYNIAVVDEAVRIIESREQATTKNLKKLTTLPL